MVAYILLWTSRIMGVQLCQCISANQVTLLMFSILLPYRESQQSTIYLLLWIVFWVVLGGKIGLLNFTQEYIIEQTPSRHQGKCIIRYFSCRNYI